METCSHVGCNHPEGECIGACLEEKGWQPYRGVAQRACENLAEQLLATKSALDVQVGGGHYKDMPVQPVEYIHKNGIGYFEGCVIKYVSRWRRKNGVEDLKKARHFLDLLIELEQANGT